MKTSALTRYYLIYLIEIVLIWGVMSLVGIDFYFIIFLMVGFVWPMTLMTPRLKDKVYQTGGRFSFLTVVYKLNHFLQMLINKKNIWYVSSLIRLISPLLFIVLVNIFGGNGEFLPIFIGWFLFEVSHFGFKRFYQEKEISPLDDIISP